MRIPSPSVLATWPTPNYDDPVTRGPAEKIVGVALTTLVTLILAIRLYTRLRIVRSFGLDDILILIAFVPSLAFTICGIFSGFNLGWGRHMWDVRTNVLVESSQMSLVTFGLFDLSSTLVKLSTLAMLWRLVRPTKSRMKIITLVTAAFVIGSGVLFIFVTVFQCSPISEYWTLSFQPQNCINESLHLLAAGIINTATDFAVVLLPIKTVARLQLPRRQYVVLIGLFCAGFCACIAGCVRTYYTWRFTVDYDRTWQGWSVWVSSIIELYLGIMCASVPSCKQFFTAYLPGVIDSTRRSSKSIGSQKQYRRSNKLSVTVNTVVETTYHNRSHRNLLKDEITPLPVGHELPDIGSPISELQKAKLRPLTWPISRPSSVDEEQGLDRVSTKRSSEHCGTGSRPKAVCWP